jgi:hypothetical protein
LPENSLQYQFLGHMAGDGGFFLRGGLAAKHMLYRDFFVT